MKLCQLVRIKVEHNYQQNANIQETSIKNFNVNQETRTKDKTAENLEEAVIEVMRLVRTWWKRVEGQLRIGLITCYE